VITFPKEFVATKYPGYFWNILDNRLYSVKITGTLKPLAMQKPNQFNHYRTGWRVSVNGQRRLIELDYLKKLKLKTSTFPVYVEQMKLL